MRLCPYIHQLFLDSESTGRPVVRSMYLAHGEAGRAYEDQFMFGPDILVAPVYEENVTTRELWLPPGEWVDLWTGERLEGPAVVERPAPVDTIPVFLRGGALIPLSPPGIDTLAASEVADVVSYLDVAETDVRVVPGAALEPASLQLFNGLSVDVEPMGAAMRLVWTAGTPAGTIDDRIAFVPDTVAFEIEGDGWLSAAPSQVTFDAGGSPTALPEGTDCDDCWTWDGARSLLVVRTASEGTVVVTP